MKIVMHLLSPGNFIAEELDARGWSTTDLAARMGGDPAIDRLTVDMLIAVEDRKMVLDEKTAFGLARAFDVSPQFFVNLDRLWRGLPMIDGEGGQANG